MVVGYGRDMTGFSGRTGGGPSGVGRSAGLDLAETEGSGARPPGRIDRALPGVEWQARRWGQLPGQPPDLTFEVGDGEIEIDRLMEADNWSAAKNTGRTGRDRC